MGRSFNRDAGNTERRISEACFNQTGSSNGFETSAGKYFFESSNKSHHDGAITGTIWKYVSDTHVKRSGSFRIEPGGEVSRGPAYFKKAALTKTPDELEEERIRKAFAEGAKFVIV